MSTTIASTAKRTLAIASGTIAIAVAVIPAATAAPVQVDNRLPCSSFIDGVRRVIRIDGIPSVVVRPTTCGREHAHEAKQAAFDEFYHKAGANWSGHVYWSMHNQFACHADYARHREEWNLEPHRAHVSYLTTVVYGCNP